MSSLPNVPIVVVTPSTASSASVSTTSTAIIPSVLGKRALGADVVIANSTSKVAEPIVVTGPSAPITSPDSTAVEETRVNKQRWNKKAKYDNFDKSKWQPPSAGVIEVQELYWSNFIPRSWRTDETFTSTKYSNAHMKHNGRTVTAVFQGIGTLAYTPDYARKSKASLAQPGTPSLSCVFWPQKADLDHLLLQDKVFNEDFGPNKLKVRKETCHGIITMPAPADKQLREKLKNGETTEEQLKKEGVIFMDHCIRASFPLVKEKGPDGKFTISKTGPYKLACPMFEKGVDLNKDKNGEGAYTEKMVQGAAVFYQITIVRFTSSSQFKSTGPKLVVHALHLIEESHMKPKQAEALSENKINEYRAKLSDDSGEMQRRVQALASSGATEDGGEDAEGNSENMGDEPVSNYDNSGES